MNVQTIETASHVEPGLFEVSERAELMALGREWNELADAVDAPPFLRHEFVRTWLDNFAPLSRWRVFGLRDASGRLEAVLPMVDERTTFYGVPVRMLRSASNAHSCRFDLLARSPKSAAQTFFRRLAADPQWDLIRLGDIPDGGGGWEIVSAANAAGLPTGAWESLQSPHFDLPRSWDEMEKTLHSKFRSNLRRRRRKLEEKGKVEFATFLAGEFLEARLEEGFQLEASGWKGREGTAMTQDGATRGFYRELARSAAYRGELNLAFLRLDGRAVAFQYSLEHNGTYYLLKPGYDESLKECSPGQLLMEEVVKDCIQRGIKRFDFLGPDMPWKRDWAAEARGHHWLFIFRDTRLGRALCRAKFRWAPELKRRVSSWRH